VRPTFNVTEFQEVVNVQMNDSMRELLASFIDDVDSEDGIEIELKAFRNALLYPQGKNPNRQFNRSRSNNRFKRNDRDRHSDEYTPPADYRGVNGADHG
jgi:hypothetical protein